MSWKKNENPSELTRRSVYVFVRRNTRYPLFEAFDMPDTHESCARRSTTVSPTQVLSLLNGEQIARFVELYCERPTIVSGNVVKEFFA